jgi:hypothetical protein
LAGTGAVAGAAPPGEVVALRPDGPEAETPPVEAASAAPVDLAPADAAVEAAPVEALAVEAEAATGRPIATNMPLSAAGTALNRTSTSFVGLRG